MKDWEVGNKKHNVRQEITTFLLFFKEKEKTLSLSLSFSLLSLTELRCKKYVQPQIYIKMKLSIVIQSPEKKEECSD